MARKVLSGKLLSDLDVLHAFGNGQHGKAKFKTSQEPRVPKADLVSALRTIQFGNVAEHQHTQRANLDGLQVPACVLDRTLQPLETGCVQF